MFNSQFPEGTVITFDYDGSGNGHHYFSPFVDWDMDSHPLVNMNRNYMSFPDEAQWKQLIAEM